MKTKIFNMEVDVSVVRLMRLGGYIFLLVGAIFLAVGAGILFADRRMTAGFEETQGRIVAFDGSDHPIVAYTVRGHTYMQRSNFTSNTMVMGDELTVRYDPQDPERMLVTGGGALLFLPILFMGMGGLFALIGLAWLRFFRVRREPENPWAGPQT